MVQALKEHEKLVAKVLCELEKAEKHDKTIYAAVCRASEAFGEDPDNLPEDFLDSMYAAITQMAKARLTGLCGDGVRRVHAAFEAMKKLSDTPTPEQVKKLQKQFEDALLPFMFLASVVKTVTDDIDYEYLAEQMLETGRAAAKKAKEQPTSA